LKISSYSGYPINNIKGVNTS